MLSLLGICALIIATSLAARFVVWLPPDRLRASLPWLQSIAAGLLLGDALMHMLPRGIALGVPVEYAGAYLALGVLLLLVLECLVRAMHQPSTVAPFARMDIVGDALHHLVDGIVVGASFAIDQRLGLVVALAVIGHELPREMANAGVLVSGGYSPRNAFLLTVATTLPVPVGAIGFALLGRSSPFPGIALLVAAGTIGYLAVGDLIPNIWPRLSDGFGRHFTPAAGVAAGLVFMSILTLVDHP